MKELRIGFFVIIVIAIIYLIFSFSQDYLDESERMLKQSDSTEISGTIRIIEFNRKLTHIILNNDKEYFLITGHLKQLQDLNVWDIGYNGDSIYKKKFGDSLFLFKKNGANYYFKIYREF
jgi:hypothetical protein